MRFAAYVEFEVEREWRALPDSAVELQAGFALLEYYDDDPDTCRVNTTDAPKMVSKNSVRLELQ